MKLFRTLLVVLYLSVYLVIGGVLICIALNACSAENIQDVLDGIASYDSARVVLGILGIAIIILGILRARAILFRMGQNKTIAFENPDGQVTVSLSAIEDFVKKSVHQFADVKELRSNVTANKRGINIECMATIFSDSNIPQTTEKIQSLVKSKVQEMLGVEEAINIKINVTKISAAKGRREDPAALKENEDSSRRMPFSGIE